MKFIEAARQLMRGTAMAAAVIAFAIGGGAMVVWAADDIKAWKLETLVGSTPVIRDWSCGCPSPAPSLADRNKSEHRKKYPLIPTRCWKENSAVELKKRSGRPMNDENVEYPAYSFPEGFPSSFGKKVGDPVPFPGWPFAYSKKLDDARSDFDAYRDKYKAEYEKEGTPPGKNKPGWVYEGWPVRKTPPNDPWLHWQIHHIMELDFGGEPTNKDNLVPMYSLPNSGRYDDKESKKHRKTAKTPSNMHNAYTQWWKQITLDNDVLGSRSKKLDDLKKSIMTCGKP